MISPLHSVVSIISASAILLVAANFSYGQGEAWPLYPEPTSPSWQQVASTTTPPVSHSAIVFDVETGEVLLEHAADTVRPIASLTKLVSAAVMWREYQAAPVNVQIAISDVVLPGTTGAVRVGEVYTPHELLFPLILTSSNHAAAALERTDTELVKAMNELTNKLGRTSATFTDASGLSDYNVASARDLQHVLTYLHNEAPHVLDISRLDNYLGTTRGWTNNNLLAADAAYRGGKQGYTPAADRTAAVIFTEDFTAGPRKIGYVILGATDSVAAVTELRTHVTKTMDWQ